MNLPPTINRRLREYYGFDEQVYTGAALDSTIRIRMEANGFFEEGDFWDCLEQSAEEFQAFAECLLVPESWFFRDRTPFSYLADWARLRLRQVTPSKRCLRILSVPCALGQEPYSIAITLLDAGLEANRFKVWAGDVSETFLQRARDGIYGPMHFRGGDASGREPYFEVLENNCLKVRDTVRQQVEFKWINLLDASSVAGLPRFDAVFCRNVLIYFAAEARQSLVKTLQSLMCADGLLCVGHADSTPMIQRLFTPTGPPGAFCYHIRASSRTAPDSGGAGVTIKPPPVAARSRIFPAQPPSRLIPTAPTTAARLAELRGLADHGNLHQAETGCRELLAHSGPAAEAYCLLGQILSARGLTREAESALRRAVYLQPDHAEALFQLALLFEQRGDKERARLLRSRSKDAPPI